MRHFSNRARLAIVIPSITLCLAGGASVALGDDGDSSVEAPAPAWAAYELENGGASVSGSVTIAADGSIAGTLPPGSTLDDVQEIPGKPNLDDLIEDASSAQTAQLKEAPDPVAGEAVNTDAAPAATRSVRRKSRGGRATPRALNPRLKDGCLRNKSRVTSYGITYWSDAYGCARGPHTAGTWLYYGSKLKNSTKTYKCAYGTSCGADPRQESDSPRCAIVSNWADLRNTSTQSYAFTYDYHYPGPCW